MRGGSQGCVVDGEGDMLCVFDEGVGPMIIMSDFPQFSLRKLACMHDCMILLPNIKYSTVQYSTVTYSTMIV